MISGLPVLLLATVVASFAVVDAKIVVVGTPVVYTNSNSRADDEIHVPNGGSAKREFHGKWNDVNAVWFTPIENFADLAKIRGIDVTFDKKVITLTVLGYPNAQDARVRIKIWADVDTSKVGAMLKL